MLQKLLPLLPMLAMLIWVGVCDFRTRRIPNVVILPLAAGGVIASFFSGGVVSPTASCLGLLLGFGIMLPQFAIGGLRGGDVKLMAAIGAWLGPMGVFLVFVIQALVGMVMVLVQCAWQGRLKVLFQNSVVLALNAAYVSDIGLKRLEETGQACRSVERPLPYAVPVLIATLIVLLWL